LVMARAFFGEGWHSNFLELNASDERGIETIRTKVKDFARTRPVGHEFKIIYLDEADALTKDAQHALRRTMEKYASICRFILGCNYLSRLILPIQSRTAVFKFKPLEEKDVSKFVERVVKGEGIKIDEDAYGIVSRISEGDLRKAVNVLQTAASTGKKITEKVIYSVASDPNPEDIRKMMELAFEKKFEDARKMLIGLLHDQGLSGEDIIREIHSQLFKMKITEEKKARIACLTGECEFRLSEGCNSQVQLEALIAQMMIA
jgi:replication factor C small subunit